jgi:hypothetical protein
MVADYDYRAFNSINKIDFTSKIPFTPNLDAIKLTKKAKILDLINSVTVSTSGLIISDSLKKIFHDFNCDPDLQVFDIRLVRNEDSWNYLFYYNFKERLSFLDFESMNFFQTRMLGLDPQPTRINSLDEFLKFEKAEGRYINPDKLIFKSPDYDLFRLYSICGGYYVSERLMNAIKEAGMTGIAFKPLDELVFLR